MKCEELNLELKLSDREKELIEHRSERPMFILFGKLDDGTPIDLCMSEHFEDLFEVASTLAQVTERGHLLAPGISDGRFAEIILERHIYDPDADDSICSRIWSASIEQKEG